ncbi:MAG TPA: hypothetical protein VGR22_06520 [Thermomicrobiales bacterium]|nr:hypothetical protein [Thermomicrobiales bacterium]
MSEAVASSAIREAPGLVRYPIARLFSTGEQLLLHPILVLPILVWLLGGTPGQIVWYAIISGIGAGLAAASGALVARLPATARHTIVGLLALQGIGVLVAIAVSLGTSSFGNTTLLTLGALAYLLITLPSAMLTRISEQNHEYRRAASATVGGVLPAIVGTTLGAIIIWRLFFIGGLGPDDMIGRLLLAGALFAAAGSWLATWPTLLARQLPHPARPMPTVRWPALRTNRPLQRYSLFQAVRGIAHFADPFLFVGVLTIIEPGIAWIGGAALAWALGEAVARLLAVRAYGAINVRGVFTVSGTLHAVAYIIIAFAADVLGSSLIAERAAGDQWRNWAVVLAALALGASHRFARTGHHAYIRSISSPGTRDLSLTVTGIVVIIFAFAPLVAVRLLESQDLATLLQIGAGASIIGLLATGLVVPTYAAPRRPRGAWGMRR